jgi:hypothetical protein
MGAEYTDHCLTLVESRYGRVGRPVVCGMAKSVVMAPPAVVLCIRGQRRSFGQLFRERCR